MPLILNHRYLPIELLRAKPSGVTFLAKDLHSEGQRYVIQQFQVQRQLSSGQLEAITKQINQEVRTLGIFGIEHEQIPVVYPCFHFNVTAFDGSRLSSAKDEFLYLVQQHIEGVSLAEELQQRGQFSAAEIIGVMLQLLPLLQFMHEHQHRILHQNITPETILRDRQGYLYLMNFGCIQTLIDRISVQAVSRASPFWFVSPEQQAGQSVSPCSDLYSLGVTLVALLTAQNLESMLDLESYRWDWSSHGPVCDPLLAQILDKMLQPVPDQRYQSAADVLAALAPLVSGSGKLVGSEISVTSSRTMSSGTTTADLEIPIATPETPLETPLEPPDDPIADALPLPTVELLNDPIDDPIADAQIVTPAAESSRELPPGNSPEIPSIELESLTDTDAAAARVQPEQTQAGVVQPVASTGTSPASLSRESESQPVGGRPAVSSKSDPLRTEQLLLPPKLLRQSLLLGSGSWLVAATLISFVGTLLASGLWLLLLVVVVFGFLARQQPFLEQTRFLTVALVAVGATFLLVPQRLEQLDIVQFFPQVLLLAVAAGLFAFILILLSQWIDDLLIKGNK
jgi:serine/threonine protein kinase